MRQSGDAYNLWLWFVLKGTPNYLADLRVQVVDAKGIRLSTVTDGPWLFAKLPPRKYTIRLPDGTREPFVRRHRPTRCRSSKSLRPDESIS
jgi:hypothetical protein